MVHGCFEMQESILAPLMWKHFSHALAIEVVVQLIIGRRLNPGSKETCGSGLNE